MSSLADDLLREWEDKMDELRGLRAKKPSDLVEIRQLEEEVGPGQGAQAGRRRAGRAAVGAAQVEVDALVHVQRLV